jgi:uncharacterized SAM-dependent methyltransferase
LLRRDAKQATAAAETTTTTTTTKTKHDEKAAAAFKRGKEVVDLDRCNSKKTIAIDHVLGSELLRYLGVDVGAAVRRLECSEQSVPFHAVRSVCFSVAVHVARDFDLLFI